MVNGTLDAAGVGVLLNISQASNLCRLQRCETMISSKIRKPFFLFATYLAVYVCFFAVAGEYIREIESHPLRLFLFLVPSMPLVYFFSMVISSIDERKK